MKTRTRLPLAGRNPESGAIAFVVAAMWMVLFGLAAFAVDMGYRYQSKFGLQAAADAAVRAGMPQFVAGNTTLATSNAIAMAGANGYPSGQVTVTPSGNLFQVDITATPPSLRALGPGSLRKPEGTSPSAVYTPRELSSGAPLSGQAR